jgi:hypothetical protein
MARTGGRELFGLAAEAGKRAGTPLALKPDYVEAAISPTCSTMRARATALSGDRTQFVPR